MTPRIDRIVLATLVLGMCWGLAARAQEVSPEDEARIATEARRHVERYYDYYYQRNPGAIATEIFTIPWIQIGADGVRITSSEAANLERFDAAIAGLIERGWNRSIFTTKNVCVLSAGSAIVSGTNTRTRADGSVMSVNGVSYILGKTDDGWRTISFSGHSTDRVVRCDPE